MSFICVICLDQLASSSSSPSTNPQTDSLGNGNNNGNGNGNGRDIITTKCGHLYHRNCLDGWLIQQKPNGTCPTCKSKIPRRTFQRVFPPESDENLELLLDLEREVTRDLRDKLERCEKRVEEMGKKFVIENIAHDLLKLEFTMKEVEVRNLQREIEKILSLHRSSQCTEKLLPRKRKKLFTDLEVIDITGSDDEGDNFTPMTLPPGTGFCIQTQDLKTGARTFVNFTVSPELCVRDEEFNYATLKTSFYDADGKLKVPIQIGKFHVGTFGGAPASLANVMVNADFFHFKTVTPEIIQNFFTHVACEQLNEKGGLILDFLHIKIMKNLKICADFEGKENLKMNEKEKRRLPVKDQTNNHCSTKKIKSECKTEYTSDVQLLEITID